jgi:CDP-glucose 4,6-dehydratase
LVVGPGPVESMVTMCDILAARFRGARVLVTGHTGFKGSWLCEWLLELGAEVHGFALAPATTPALFNQLGLAARIAAHTLGDVRDRTAVDQAVTAARPDFIFHLAAQPLVRLSYAEPVETFDTNVLGTAHVLDAARRLHRRCVVIVVTTDKCYENREWLHGYREEDPLGGHDPYSASKACAEIVTAAYRRSFFHAGDPVAVASARAGNVIGGGDWATDRIVPDCMRALAEGRPVAVRNAAATRPWQHVLEPLGGYLTLAARLAVVQQQGPKEELGRLTAAFNFGPTLMANRPVRELVQEILMHWPGEWRDASDPAAPHEAGKLMLAIDKAHHVLGWNPAWDFATSVARTVEWYRGCHTAPASARKLTLDQIRAYAAVLTVEPR